MPLLSRYLQGGQQISRFPKIAENEKTARSRHHRDGGGDDGGFLPAVRWVDHGGEVAVTSIGGPSDRRPPVAARRHRMAR